MEDKTSVIDREWQKLFRRLDDITVSRPGQSVNSILETVASEFKLPALRTNIFRYKADYQAIGKLPKKLVVGESDISVTAINIYLETKYPDFLAKIVTNESGCLYYLYYYEGTEGKIKPAIIKIHLSGNENEWGSGEIYYFKHEKGRFMLSSVFTLERVSPKEGAVINPEFFYFKALSDFPDHRHQVNFFTINVQHKPVEKRFLCFVSSSTLSFKSNLGDVPSVNFGVLKNVNYNDIEEGLNEMIHPWIRNALTKKKLTFDFIENSIYTTEPKFVNEVNSNDTDTVNLQYRCSEIVKGHYLGFYFRNEIRKSENKELGGLAVVVLCIENDGKANIHFAKSNEEKVTYKGYLQFLNNEYKKIKGNFQQKNNGLYRFALYINEMYTDSNLFGGVFSGFTNDRPFSTPILFVKLDTGDKSADELLELYKPRRISKFDFPDYTKRVFGEAGSVDYEIILTHLRNIESDYIEQFGKSAPVQ